VFPEAAQLILNRSIPLCIAQSNNRKPPHQRKTVAPAKSKQEQMAAGAAPAAKRSERSRSSLKGAWREMAESMSEDHLEEFAGIKRKNLPTKRRSR
jgi:hypothetical protein